MRYASHCSAGANPSTRTDCGFQTEASACKVAPTQYFGEKVPVIGPETLRAAHFETVPVSAGFVLARLGTLEVRLAESVADKNAAFALRYGVFCEELGAGLPGPDPRQTIETDDYDDHCDHIIVCDTSQKTASGQAPVVGTYRALRPEMVQTGYYSQTEFDIAPLLARHGEQKFCEVGRSCVAPTHRSRRTVEALWCGLWAYAALFGIDTYFGAASFVGTDPDAHAEALAYLYHHQGAPRLWRVDAHPKRAVHMDRIAAEAINPRRALRAMPPLIRGYLRVNAHVGQTGYIDDQFGTIDVMVITRLSLTPLAYRQRFSRAINKRLRPHIQ